MGKTFALITEGASEHFVIKHILQRYCDEEPVINQIQPQLIDNKQENIGGWHEVIKYRGRTSDLQEILKRNDYIVIQIDTDMCETTPYSVYRLGVANNKELWAKVRERLISLIDDTIDKSRILFAICIEEIECWLLPIVSTKDSDQCAVNNCVVRLNQALEKKNISPIVDKNSELSRSVYAKILRNAKKRKDIEAIAEYHYGFSQFLQQIKAVQ